MSNRQFLDPELKERKRNVKRAITKTRYQAEKILPKIRIQKKN